MKNKLPYLLLATTLALTPAIVMPTQVSAEEVYFEDGMYFIPMDGSQGEYYSFTAFSNLTVVQRGQLIASYGQENTKAYLSSLGKIASLGDISKSGLPFLGASKNYISGDLPGEFKNAETGEVIGVSPEVNDFSVLSID